MNLMVFIRPKENQLTAEVDNIMRNLEGNECFNNADTVVECKSSEKHVGAIYKAIKTSFKSHNWLPAVVATDKMVRHMK